MLIKCDSKLNDKLPLQLVLMSKSFGPIDILIRLKDSASRIETCNIYDIDTKAEDSLYFYFIVTFSHSQTQTPRPNKKKVVSLI